MRLYPQLLILILACMPFALSAKVNHNLNTQQQGMKLKNYYQSGRYFNEMEEILKEAKDYLVRQTAQPRAHRLAIVLDIDETALSNYEDLERLYFTHNVPALTAAYMLSGAQPISPVLTLYKEAKEHNVAVFFISERPNTPEMVSVTVNNLRKAGFDQWQELVLKPIDNDESIKDFKTKARRNISAQGYDIVLNIGDQSSDLQGGFAEVKVKIPNPFYEVS